MKTSRTRAAGQQTGRKATARSTSAQPHKTRAKAQPRPPAAIRRGSLSGEGERIDAPPCLTPAPSPAQVTLIGAMLGILHHLADARDTARNIEGTLTSGLDLATNANDLRRCIHSLSLDLDLLGFEAEACCRELTGEEGPRSLLCHAIDLARLDGVFSRRSPQGQRQAVAVDEHVAKRAAQHFARSA